MIQILDCLPNLCPLLLTHHTIPCQLDQEHEKKRWHQQRCRYYCGNGCSSEQTTRASIMTTEQRGTKNKIESNVPYLSIFFFELSCLSLCLLTWPTLLIASSSSKGTYIHLFTINPTRREQSIVRSNTQLCSQLDRNNLRNVIEKNTRKCISEKKANKWHEKQQQRKQRRENTNKGVEIETSLLLVCSFVLCLHHNTTIGAGLD